MPASSVLQKTEMLIKKDFQGYQIDSLRKL